MKFSQKVSRKFIWGLKSFLFFKRFFSEEYRFLINRSLTEKREYRKKRLSLPSFFAVVVMLHLIYSSKRKLLAGKKFIIFHFSQWADANF